MTTTEIAKRPIDDKSSQMISVVAEATRATLLKTVNADRYIGLMEAALRNEPKLRDCDLDSLYGALMFCAQLSLEPNSPLQHAHLIPLAGKCEVWIGYRGRMELVSRLEGVTSVYGGVVHEGDELIMSYGDVCTFEHRPARRNRGAVDGYYAYIGYSDRPARHVYMTLNEVNEVRDNYSSAYRKAEKGKKDSAWHKSPDPQGVKTALNRLCSKMALPAAAMVGLHSKGHDESTVTNYTVSTAATAPKQIESSPTPKVVDVAASVDVTEEDVKGLAATAARINEAIKATEPLIALAKALIDSGRPERLIIDRCGWNLVSPIPTESRLASIAFELERMTDEEEAAREPAGETPPSKAAAYKELMALVSTAGIDHGISRSAISEATDGWDCSFDTAEQMDVAELQRHRRTLEELIEIDEEK